MAFETFKGTFAKSTGGAPASQSITGLTFLPKAIIMWTDAETVAGVSAHLRFSMGFSDGTTHFCVGETSEDNVADSNCGRMNSNKVISLYSVTPALLAECDLTSFDDNGGGDFGFTVNWTTNDGVASLIHYFVLGGDDLTNVKCNVFTAITTQEEQSITSVGFRSDCLLFLGTTISTDPPNVVAGNASISMGAAGGTPTRQVSMAGYSEDAQGFADTAKHLAASTCIQFLGNKSGIPSSAGRAVFVSHDADGFTVDWVAQPVAAYRVGYLSLKGGKYFMSSVVSPNLAAGSTQVVTGVGFEPKGIMFWSHAATSADIRDHQGPGIGAASAAGVEGWLAALDRDGATVMEANTRSLTDKVMSFEDVPAEPLGVDEECNLASFDADGYTLEWTTLADAQNKFSFLCFGDLPPVVDGQPITRRRGGSTEPVGAQRIGRGW